MTLDQLKYFLAAAKFSHIGKAAVFSHISPSAVSNAVAVLEDELGCLLFKREGKQIFLTDQGALLRDRAQAILGDIDALSLEVAGNNSALRGHFRLAASHFLSARILGKAWGALNKKYPKLSAELCSMSTHLVLSEIISGTLDAGLCFSPLQHPSLSSQDIYKGSLQLCYRKKHPLSKLKPAEAIKEISNYPAVIHKASAGVDICEFHPMFEKFGIKPNVDLFFDNDDFAIQRLVGSDAWSILPDIVVQSDRRLDFCSPTSGWLAPYTVALVTRRQRESNKVLDLLSEEIGKMLPSKSSRPVGPNAKFQS